MKVKIYYSDTEYVGERRGVQAIVQLNGKVGWYVESHGDIYLKKEDELWHAADFDGLFTELKKRGLIRPSIGLIHEVRVGLIWKRVDVIGFHEWLETLDWVLFGETIDNDRFQEIFQQALSDADFGRKHGYLAGERKP
jgi:hypothetical protein